MEKGRRQNSRLPSISDVFKIDFYCVRLHPNKQFTNTPGLYSAERSAVRCSARRARPALFSTAPKIKLLKGGSVDSPYSSW
jgi:hypothetical protein